MLPTGNVTFLFTDIQGSTTLWQQHPQAMPEALSRHHALLRQAIEAHHGYVFQIIGDAFCAAFHTGLDGLNAAIEAQRLLHNEPWGETGPIRVRMGLHSGMAEVHSGEYTSGEYLSGLTLSRAARLLSAGHGGQVLLSLPSAELVRDQLPTTIELRDLGKHRLKDLIRPEHIFQIVTPDLPADFPPIKTLDARPHNLPLQLTSFVGRVKNIHEIQSCLSSSRLLTLVGPGGAGKTRLALQAAAESIDEYSDGAWFVDLSSLTDPRLVPQALADAWGLREQPWRSLTEIIIDYLRGKKILIILDNCEHLAQASAILSQALLQASTSVKILATSREPLGVPGEELYPVPTLSLPNPNSQASSETILQAEAVRLFVDRASTAQPSFTLNNANSPAVAMICQRLDGIPLAIELAAARLRAFSVEQVAARIEDRFRLLTGGSRTSLPRQQTLRALIDWSYNLLTEQERLLFARLSVFQGGWTLEAAEATCAGSGIASYDILDLLARLVDRSLVGADDQGKERRYRLLETIRQYAAEVLNESGQQATWRDRHLETFLALAEEAEPRIRSAQDIIWMDLVEQDHDNLRQAIDWAAEVGNTQVVLRLCAGLYYFWFRRGHIQEGARQLQRVVDLPDARKHPLELTKVLKFYGFYYWLHADYQTALEIINQSIDLHKTIGREGSFSYALALYYLGMTHMRLGNFSAAQNAGQESLAIFQEIQEDDGLAITNYLLGRIQLEQGQIQPAKNYLVQALECSRRAGDRLVISMIINSLGMLAVSEGDYTEAQAYNQESLELARQMQDVWMIAGALREAGNIAQARGEYEQARVFFSESGELSRQQGLQNDLARTRCKLGYLAILQSNLPIAKSFLQEGLELFRQLNHRRGQTEILDGWAAYAAASGQSELAARLQGAADASFQSLGVTRWPLDSLEYQKLRTALLEILGEAGYQAAHANGEILNLDQALEQTQILNPL